jgi:hypothetical protein
MTVVRHPENDAIVDIGDFRIEPGPPLIETTATKDLLNDNNTAPHYQPGLRDAKGNVIQIGETFSYLDWGGNTHEGKRVFYVYRKVAVNSKDELVDGKLNPYFVPQHVKDAAVEGGNRVFYDYRFEEVDTFDTEEEAIKYCEKYR